MNNETIFRDKPVWQAIFSMAIPAVATILIMVLYNMADMFFIGMLGDDAQVAAVSVVSPVFNIANALATMLGSGGCALIARALGARERDTAETVGSQVIWVSIVLGIAFATGLLAATGPVLRILSATEDLMDYAAAYLRVLAVGSPLMLFSVAVASIVRAEGIVVPAMIANLAGTVTNILLDPLFILVFDLGVSGAALATVLSNLLSCVLLVRCIHKHSTVLHFSLRYCLHRPTLLLNTLALGLPSGTSSILSGLASSFSNQLLSLYGSGAIAAMAAASRCTLVINMVQMGVCIGVAPLLAYNCGAGAKERVGEVLRKTALLTAAFGLIAAAGCFLGRDALIGLFLSDSTNAELGRQLMLFLLLASPLLGIYYLSSNFLQAAGNAALATVISLLRQGLLLIPSMYLLHGFLGLTGVAAAYTVSDFLAVVAALFCILRQYRLLKDKTVCNS